MSPGRGGLFLLISAFATWATPVPWPCVPGGVIQVELVIPEGLSLAVGQHAFQGCWNLTSVTLPASVTSVGNTSFLTCYGFGLSVDGVKGYATRGRVSCLRVAAGAALIIPGNVTAIGESAFAFSEATSVSIPNSVTSIGSMAFNGCQFLRSLDIADSVVHIGSLAFCQCTELTSVAIPSRLTAIASSTFFGCGSLLSVTIPASVRFIGIASFYECPMLQTVVIATRGVTCIEDSAFEGCSYLPSIIIPATVTYVGKRAFADCTTLKTLEINVGVPFVAPDAFIKSGCQDAAKHPHGPINKLTNATVVDCMVDGTRFPSASPTFTRAPTLTRHTVAPSFVQGVFPPRIAGKCTPGLPPAG